MLKTVTRVMVLLGCSATTESFYRSVPVRGSPGPVRAALASAHQVLSSDADPSAYYANATVTAARDPQLHRDLRHRKSKKNRESSFDTASPSPSRRKTRSSLGIVNSSLLREKRMRRSSLGNATPSSFGLGASLHSPSELKLRVGAGDPGPPNSVGLVALVPEAASRALAGDDTKPCTDAYYSDYCESEPVGWKESGWKGIGDVLIASAPIGENPLQSSQGESTTFKRVEIRAAWRECQGKSLRRSAAPIVDLVGLAAPLLFIVGFSLTA